MIGFDTSFFVFLWQKNQQAQCIWNRLISGEEEGAISVLTLYELRKLVLKGALKTDYTQVRTLLIDTVTLILVTPEISEDSASLSHQTGLHMADAIILTSCLKIQCKTLYTDNISHFSLYHGKEIEIKAVSSG